MQLIAARTGQEYNIRKQRRGAFWEDRYHATGENRGRGLNRALNIGLSVFEYGGLRKK
jgi:putative transposase